MQVYFSLSTDLSKTHTLFPYLVIESYFNDYVGTGTFRSCQFHLLWLYTQKKIDT